MVTPYGSKLVPETTFVRKNKGNSMVSPLKIGDVVCGFQRGQGRRKEEEVWRKRRISCFPSFVFW